MADFYFENLKRSLGYNLSLSNLWLVQLPEEPEPELKELVYGFLHWIA